MTRLHSRRQILAAAAACGTMALAGPLTASSPKRFFGPDGQQLGLQLYTLGMDALRDLDATFAAVAQIGYQTVELLGLLDFVGQKPKNVRAALDRAGLIARSTQIPFQNFGAGPNLSANIEEIADGANVIGLESIVSPIFTFPVRIGMPKPGEDGGSFAARAAAAMTADDWKAYAGILNERGAILKRRGLRIGHHNHNADFTPLGDTTGYDIIVTHTDPDLVTLELDVGWVAAAGLDPVTILNRYPGRFTMMHVKDIKASTVRNYAMKQDPAEVGTGILDFKVILPAARRAGVTGYYVEQEPPFSVSRMDAVRKSYTFLKQLQI